MKILVMGGSVFVSRYVAQYFVDKGEEVIVVNRNTHEQVEGVTLIKADRHMLGEALAHVHVDVIIDVNAYTKEDVEQLLNAIGSYRTYVLISSSAVYPQTNPMPFHESSQTGYNRFWKEYGMNKIEAEHALLKRDAHAYILRPPYLYGPYNNIYREAFVFDCAMLDRVFYLPQDGKMKLQFFHVHDLCRFIDILVEKKPSQQIFNVGNPDMISIQDWVTMGYEAVGKSVEFVHVAASIEQRKYFSFHPYEYQLDVSAQCQMMSDFIPLKKGLEDSLQWYVKNQEKVIKKPLIEYIDQYLK